MEEEGVTPVVGVVLLLAITIILISIIADFALNLVNENVEMMENTVENMQRALEIYSPY